VALDAQFQGIIIPGARGRDQGGLALSIAVSTSRLVRARGGEQIVYPLTWPTQLHGFLAAPQLVGRRSPWTSDSSI